VAVTCGGESASGRAQPPERRFKDYVCNECDRRFKTEKTLKIHMRMHGGGDGGEGGEGVPWLLHTAEGLAAPAVV
jgi:hypothetical protein